MMLRQYHVLVQAMLVFWLTAPTPLACFQPTTVQDIRTLYNGMFTTHVQPLRQNCVAQGVVTTIHPPRFSYNIRGLYVVCFYHHCMFSCQPLCGVTKYMTISVLPFLLCTGAFIYQPKVLGPAFGSFYGKFVPLAKEILDSTPAVNHTAESTSLSQQNTDMLRGKAMEAIALMGQAVGIDIFRADAHQASRPERPLFSRVGEKGRAWRGFVFVARFEGYIYHWKWCIDVTCPSRSFNYCTKIELNISRHYCSVEHYTKRVPMSSASVWLFFPPKVVDNGSRTWIKIGRYYLRYVVRLGIFERIFWSKHRRANSTPCRNLVRVLVVLSRCGDSPLLIVFCCVMPARTDGLVYL